MLSQLLQPQYRQVSFKIFSEDLGDYFEGLNDRQCMLAVEGALNIIFNPAIVRVGVPGAALIDYSMLDLNGVESPTWETVEDAVTDRTVFGLIHNKDQSTYTGDSELLRALSVAEEEGCDVEMENVFNGILAKLAEDVSADVCNQDIGAIYGLMTEYNWMEVVQCAYVTPGNFINILANFS